MYLNIYWFIVDAYGRLRMCLWHEYKVAYMSELGRERPYDLNKNGFIEGSQINTVLKESYVFSLRPSCTGV